MILITEHTKDIAVLQWSALTIRLSPHFEVFEGCFARKPDVVRQNKVLLSVQLGRKWGKIGNAEMLKFLERGGSNIDRFEYDGDMLRVHFFRCNGANRLYHKLLRACAVQQFPKATSAEHSNLCKQLHKMLVFQYNEGNETKKLKPSEFHAYFMECQATCVRAFGVIFMDEDKVEFDHGFEPVNGPIKE